MSNDSSGHLHTVDELGLAEFEPIKEDALKIIEQLRGGAKQRWRLPLVKSAISGLYEKYHLNQTYKLSNELKLCRVRKLVSCARESWLSSADKLGPRKAEEVTDYGRCHHPQQSIGYFSPEENIALSEVNAELDDCISIAIYKLTENLIVVPIGELDFFRRTGQTRLGSAKPEASQPYSQILDEPNGNLRALVDAFFADEFIQRASTKTDYKITASISDLLLNDKNLETQIDAIFYPSVAFRDGYNFAIRPEFVKKNMKLVETETKVVRISEVLGYGIFKYDVLSTLRSVNTTGELEWA
ncbi:hypothetical protein GALL_65920 [mine drainage metagenome]|uniref:Uncharacterized protein n=1 Tax=mine drainage metagenome TaxID=410659 RepID=A0A1J5T687_9ZZZZ